MIIKSSPGSLSRVIVMQTFTIFMPIIAVYVSRYENYHKHKGHNSCHNAYNNGDRVWKKKEIHPTYNTKISLKLSFHQHPIRQPS